MSDKKVLPVDDVTVYATDKLKGLYTEGAPIVCHSCIAEKLLADGKATKEDPSAESKKGGKKDA